MKKALSLITALVIVIALLVISGAVYTIDETQQVVITQFGEPIGKPITDAGLHFKIPFIRQANYFDKRILEWDGNPNQIPTKDKKYIWVDTTARWYIEDPLRFYRSVGTEEQAHARLDDIIDASTRNSITKRELIEIVRTDNRPMRVAEEELQETTQVGQVSEGRPKIVAEITEASRQACAEYGISIHESGVLVKGLTYVDSVKEKVEERMIEERLRIAKKYTSEGEGEFEKIMGDKEREVKTILSEAYKTAKDIEGEADAKATKIYADAFGKDPDFYRFWKTLELYQGAVGGEKTRLLLGTDNPLLELLKGNLVEVGGASRAKEAGQ